MKFYLPQKLKALRNFGRVPLTSSDFNEMTYGNKIEITLSSRILNGFYFYSPRGRHNIVIASRLSPEMRRWVGWHEFAHYLQNYWKPVTAAAGCKIGEETDLERQANAFATIATTRDLTLTDPLDFIDSIMGGGIRVAR